ncbi:MAG TPA: bifunctional glutamate N-acetyltransferase/amino-acid acetyltransferase ArgJ [Acidimicrobiales bacterium]|nr:bifunctional glutamate N-acetyltransferase/amino-acid acetyltransferase ArgJ [Acidimicrobiales bacterium]
MSVTGPAGFVAASGAAGIKANGSPDVAVVATADGRPVAAAGVFTTNLAPAGPVVVSREHLAASGGRAAAVVLTSGNANAANGGAGKAAASRLCELVGEGIGAEVGHVLIGQTGLIGVPFPIEVASGAVGPIVANRGSDRTDASGAAHAILTTDTVAKEVLVERDGFSVGAMAKGAAMLAPHMATMLALLTTDARVDPPTLHAALTAAVGPSFNSLTVDGCTSTNDTVLVLASGLAGPPGPGALESALAEVCAVLAGQMAADAEGATKVARIRVTGAASDGQAHQAARKVADSLLVKCSFNGEDPYWGRVVSELGTAGVDFDPDLVSVSYGGVTVCRAGVAAAHDRAAVRAHMSGRDIDLHCELGLGNGSGAVLTTDLGYGYIDENRTTS